jgi:hypothetical protein
MPGCWGRFERYLHLLPLWKEIDWNGSQIYREAKGKVCCSFYYTTYLILDTCLGRQRIACYLAFEIYDVRSYINLINITTLNSMFLFIWNHHRNRLRQKKTNRVLKQKQEKVSGKREKEGWNLFLKSPRLVSKDKHKSRSTFSIVMPPICGGWN